jgi:hypothetical protein
MPAFSLGRSNCDSDRDLGATAYLTLVARESFRDEAHLAGIIAGARDMVSRALAE